MPAALLLATFALAQNPSPTVRMAIIIAGADAGSNTYTARADGSFESETTLAIAGIRIGNTIKGRFTKDGVISEYVADQVHSQTGTTKLALKNGKLKVTAGGKTEAIDVAYKGKATFGNFHPQLTASTLKEVVWQVGKAQKMKSFMFEGGTEIDLTVTPKGEKTTSAGAAKLYHLDLGNLGIDLAMTDEGIVVGEDVPSQKLRFVAEGWSELYVDPLAKYPELSQPTFKVKTERGVKMKTKDGVVLVADIIRPDGKGKFPVILTRTPYGREAETIAGESYAKRGYVYIAQDCRGRSDSGGEWDPFVNEERDGEDTLNWIIAQPWSDGKVGMIGASYGGLVQWSAAMRKHPALKCIIPQVSPPDAMRNIPYDQGVFFLYGNLWWGRIVSEKKANLGAVGMTVPAMEKLTTLPLSKVDEAVFGKNIPFFDRWLERESLADWKGFNYTEQLGEIEIPALHISGWWDGDNIGTKTNWAMMRAAGRKNQWLIYGPWTHAFNTTRKMGDVDYGDKAIIDLDSVYLRWFDTWLKGKEVGMEKVPHVQAFVTGANRWIPLNDWPAATTPVKTLYLASSGRLLNAPVAKDKPSRYTYDPAKEVIPEEVKKMKVGEGSTKIDSIDKKDGTLIWKTEPLPAAMAIGGPLEVNLSFQTSARDTDFFAILLDIAPNGEMRGFGQSGKLRASYLGGFDKRVPLTPNRTYMATIRPWDTAHELKTGHRLGLMLTSSAFPFYARNMGTGEPIKNATRMVVQKNTILHSAKNPSSVKFRVLW